MALLLGWALSCLTPPNAEAANYKPGFCPVTEKRIINRSGRAQSNYRIAWFELNNGSRMPVAVDKDAMISEEDFEKIMQHIIDGWQWEINQKKWTPEQIQSYKDTYFNLTIEKIIE